jgi:hypothetical protein
LRRKAAPRVVQGERQARPGAQAARREPQGTTGRIPEQALDGRPHVVRFEVRGQDLARVRGYPVIIPCDFRYLNGTAGLLRSGFKSLSMRWIELTRIIDSLVLVKYS